MCLSMILWLKKYYFQFQIMLLVIFKPTVLFDKINQLKWYKGTLHQWVDDQKFSTKSTVLEVGCASGALTAYVAELDCIPTGIDSSKKMIELAKANNKGVSFLVENALDLTFNDESFDAVIAASLLNIVSDKDKVVSELYRTCKKGGVISTLVPSATFKDKNLLALQTSVGETGFSVAAMQAWHNRAPKMKENDILLLFTKAGLTKIRTKSYLQGMVISVSATKPY